MFLAFLVTAYFVLLAALAWRALGGRSRAASKNHPVGAASVAREGRTVLRLFSRKKKQSVADGYQHQLQSVISEPRADVQESDHQWSLGFFGLPSAKSIASLQQH